MKNLLYILLFLPGLLLAQAPEGINYQALIRNASGVEVANQNVGIQLSLLQGSASGSAVYKETFSPTTNDFGLVNLQIGAGISTLGNFSSIDWSNGTYFIETAVDVSGGTSYVVISTTQFMSVPYALYAKNAALDSAGVQGIIDANTDFDADTTNELQTLSYINDTLSISGGNRIQLNFNKQRLFYFEQDEIDTLIIPNGVTVVDIIIVGGNGGNGGSSAVCTNNHGSTYVRNGGNGGNGGMVRFLLPCLHSDEIIIHVASTIGIIGQTATSYCIPGTTGSIGFSTTVTLNGILVAEALGGFGGTGARCTCGYGGGGGSTGYQGSFNLHGPAVFMESGDSPLPKAIINF